MSEEIKIEIGKRIREERERLGLTREQVCDTEEELTVKQLMRIELGRSLPTIVKLQYISDKLGVSLNRSSQGSYLYNLQAFLEVMYSQVLSFHGSCLWSGHRHQLPGYRCRSQSRPFHRHRTGRDE